MVYDESSVSGYTAVEAASWTGQLARYRNDCIFKTIVLIIELLGWKRVQDKKKVKQSRYRPGMSRVFQEVMVPRFHENGTGWW